MADVLREVLDSDEDREQDDLSSDDSFDNNIQSISDVSCIEDEDSSVMRVTQHVDSESGTNSSVVSSSVTSVTDSFGRSSSSAVSLLSVLKAPKASDLSRKRCFKKSASREEEV